MGRGSLKTDEQGKQARNRRGGGEGKHSGLLSVPPYSTRACRQPTRLVRVVPVELTDEVWVQDGGPEQTAGYLGQYRVWMVLLGFFNQLFHLPLEPPYYGLLRQDVDWGWRAVVSWELTIEGIRLEVPGPGPGWDKESALSLLNTSLGSWYRLGAPERSGMPVGSRLWPNSLRGPALISGRESGTENSSLPLFCSPIQPVGYGGITKKEIVSEWFPEVISVTGIVLWVTRAMTLPSKALAV